MELVVDGLIYQMQSHGGISRIFNEILPIMCDLDDTLSVAMFTTGLCLQALPRHQRIVHKPPQTISRMLYPGWLWNPIIELGIRPQRKYILSSSADSIWHSTYYTYPEGWKGRQVVTVVDLIQEKFPEIFSDERNARVRERKRLCAVNSDAVICISESTRQDVLLCYGVDPDKVKVIHLAHSNVFKKMDSPSGIDVGGRESYILYIGAREDYKNFKILLKAYRTWKRCDDFNLLAVGHPWSVAEKRLLTDLGVENKVRIVSNVDDEELCRLYNHAAAFVYPSLYEGFGIPLLEAMACGCPLVASDIPSTREIANDIPFYFDPLDAESLVRALEDAVRLDRISARITRGLARAGEFSWTRAAQQTLEVYHALISQ